MVRTVLITGCSSGIGRATALAFLERGWSVYATARDPADVADLEERGCETAQLDVTVPDHVEAAVDRLLDEAGHIDCLVNNAGYSQTGAVEEIPASDVRYQFDVNVFGPHRLVRAVLPHMRERGRGTIITVSSTGGRVVIPGYGVYCATKHAVEGLHDALRAETAPFGIDVVLVEPGFTRSQYYETAAETLGDVADPESPYEPLYDRLGTLRDRALRYVAVEPETAAGVIVAATEAERPAARYPVGLHARLILLARWLPDRLFDRLNRAIYRW